jgi:hypothetical protein
MWSFRYGTVGALDLSAAPPCTEHPQQAAATDPRAARNASAWQFFSGGQIRPGERPVMVW